MNIFKLLFELFLLYLVYKLVFELIIPVFNTTRQMKQKMADMQERMREEQARRPEPAPVRQPEKVDSSEYIDFEEVK